ncbi:MAG: hypothetical protein OJF47_003846 [Nitrospira sp.]|nr:MAG: hypothetical protein OJF47_003846 [Nitrospira sp.]
MMQAESNSSLCHREAVRKRVVIVASSMDRHPYRDFACRQSSYPRPG